MSASISQEERVKRAVGVLVGSAFPMISPVMLLELCEIELNKLATWAFGERRAEDGSRIKRDTASRSAAEALRDGLSPEDRQALRRVGFGLEGFGRAIKTLRYVLMFNKDRILSFAKAQEREDTGEQDEKG